MKLTERLAERLRARLIGWTTPDPAAWRGAALRCASSAGYSLLSPRCSSRYRTFRGSARSASSRVSARSASGRWSRCCWCDCSVADRYRSGGGCCSRRRSSRLRSASWCLRRIRRRPRRRDRVGRAARRRLATWRANGFTRRARSQPRSAQSARRRCSRVVVAWLGRTGTARMVAADRSPRSICRIPVQPAVSVRTLTYGSGQRCEREEFGSKVDLVSESVDGSKTHRRVVGPAGWARTQYWGFDAKRVAAARPRLVPRRRRSVSAGADGARQSRHGGFLRSRLRVSRRTVREPRHHRGVGGRELPQQLQRRSARRASKAD